MWRIHFSSADLTRVRLATRPDPMLELAFSMRMAASRTTRSDLVFGRWRRRNARRLSWLASLPSIGSWCDDVIAGVRRDLGPPLHAYHLAALAPHWAHIHQQISHQLHRHARDLATGGTHQLLGGASPHLSWDAPVLTARAGGLSRDVHLEGRGLLLQPSFFADDEVTLVRPDAATITLAYPIPVQPGWCSDTDGTQDPPLDRLLGPTRARALQALAHEALGTSRLAAALQISVPAASLQAKVLREAGLVVSHHQGKNVIHFATALGIELAGVGSGRLSTA